MKKTFILCAAAIFCFSLFLLLIPAFPQAEAVSAPPTQIIGGEDSGLINLLLIGLDGREDNTPARADTIILCSLRPQTKTVTITSFLRDLYVEIPGQEGNRLNSAYAFGGMELLTQTMEDNFHLFIDGCIAVDFSCFSQIIDALGGVTLELRQDEADTINRVTDSDLKEGIQQLTGCEALAYSRIRNLDQDGDFSRTARQRKLLSSLLEEYRNASLLTTLSVVVDTLPLISTDLSKKEILLLAARSYPMLEQPVVVSQRIPEAGTYEYATIRKMEVLTADMDTIRKTLRNSLLPEKKSEA